MVINKSRCLVLIVEGATDRVFYARVVEKYFPREWKRKGELILINFKTVGRISNKSVVSWVESFLKNQPAVKGLDVIVTYDRDGDFNTPDKIDCKIIKSQLGKGIFHVEQIIATRELESWFHYDVEGLYDFFGKPKGKRKSNPYPSPHSLSADDLVIEAAKHNKDYKKGGDAEKLLNHLNLDTIYTHCKEFRKGVELLKKLL